MSITSKKPMVKETVGALYYTFNETQSNEEFNPEKYEESVVKSDVVKNIGTTENAEAVTVKSSGQDYMTVNQNESIEMAIEVVAFDPGDLAKMRGDIIGENGLNRSGRTTVRPFFAFGKVVKKVGGAVEYAWYPKCQLVENTDDIATKEETFTEQNDTVTIKAYSFNNADDKKMYVNSEMSNFPKGLTEEKFFAKPILTDEDLAAAVTLENPKQEIEGA